MATNHWKADLLLVFLVCIIEWCSANSGGSREFQCLFQQGDFWPESNCEYHYKNSQTTGAADKCNEKLFGLNCCNYCRKKGTTPMFQCKDEIGGPQGCTMYKRWQKNPKYHYFLAVNCFASVFCTNNPPQVAGATNKPTETTPKPTEATKKPVEPTKAPVFLQRPPKPWRPVPILEPWMLTRAPATSVTTTATTTTDSEEKTTVSSETTTEEKQEELTRKEIIKKFTPGRWFPLYFGRRG